MVCLFSIDDYLKSIKSIKESGRMICNCLLSIADIITLSNKEESFLSSTEGATILCYKEYSEWWLFFFLSSWEKACLIKKLLPSEKIKRVYISYIGREDNASEAERTLKENGFLFYAKLKRRACESFNFVSRKRLTDKMFCKAKMEESEQILELLYKEFDPIVSRLPDKEKLEEWIDRGYVFCAKKDNTVIGATICRELGNKVLFSNQTVVVDGYQGSGVGLLLFEYGVSHYPNCTKIYGWVEERNKASERMCDIVHLFPDGICEVIMYL